MPRFVYSSIDRHLSYFHSLVFVNNTAINMGVQTFVQVSTFSSFGYISRSEIAGWWCVYSANSLQPKSCPTLCSPMDSSLPGSSVHGVFQLRVLEQVAISYSRGSSQTRNWTHISCVGRWICYPWATREAHVSSSPTCKNNLRVSVIWHYLQSLSTLICPLVVAILSKTYVSSTCFICYSGSNINISSMSI